MIRILLAIILVCLAGINQPRAQLVWSPPSPVDPDAATESRHDTAPQVVVGPDNAVALGWISESYAGTTTITQSRHSDVFVTYSTDSAQTWSAIQFISDPENLNSSLDIAAGATGEFLFAWSSGDIFSGFRLHSDVTQNYGAAYADTLTTQPFTGSEMGFIAPHIIKAGGVNVLSKSSWNTDINYDSADGYLLTQAGSGAGGWAQAEKVELPESSHFYHIITAGLAPDGGNNAVAVYTCMFDDTNNVTHYRLLAMTSNNSGVTWTNRGYITPDSLATGDAALESDGNGGWMVVCALRNSTAGAEPVIALRSADNGATWSAPIIIAPPAGTVNVLGSPALATDNAGNWLAVFEGHEEDTTTGYQADSEIFYSMSTDDGLTWSVMTTVNPAPATDAAIDARPSAGYLGAGNWAVFWSRSENGADSDIVKSVAALPAGVYDWQLF